MDPALVFGLFAGVGIALVVSLSALALTYMARPAALRRETDLLSDALSEFERELARQSGKGTELLKSVESIHQVVVDDLDRAETKRKQAAAKNSKGKNNEPEFDVNDRVQLAALARSRGML